MSSTGYINLELSSLQLNFVDDPSPAADLVLKADATIIDSSGVFKWASNGKPIVSSASLTAFRRPADEPAGSDEVLGAKPETVYTLGFESFGSQMTQYIDLNETVLAALSSVLVKVTVSKADASGAATTPFVVLDLPVASLLVRRGCSISTSGQMLDVGLVACSNGVSPSTSSLNLSLYADNNLAEACIGCKILQWSNAKLSNPPAKWGLDYTEPVDPKAKVQPTPADLRAKYLAAIPGLVANQASLVRFTMAVGAAPAPALEGEEPAPAPAIPLTEVTGKLSWDAGKAALVPATDDIRGLGNLWSLNFGGNGGGVFLSRGRVRGFIEACGNGGISAIPVTISRTPLDATGVATGVSVTATGSLDLSPIGAVGATSHECSVLLSGEGFVSSASGAEEVGEAKGDEAAAASGSALSTFEIGVTISTPLADKQAEPRSPGNDSYTSRNTTKFVKQSSNKDAISELKEQITRAVKAIATEYLAIYPADRKDDKSYEDKKIEFMHYLSTSGTYHSLKEELKPKIQRAVRAQFGPRGQAMQSSSSAGAGAGAGAALVLSDQLLSELYVFLVKQCNQVLNSIFHATVIDRDTAELSQQASIVDDEGETAAQKLAKLAQQADDAEADGRVVDAEQRHLERLQIFANTPSLKADPATKHAVYYALGLFYLKQSSKALQSSAAAGSWGDAVGAASHKAFAEYNASRAREALSAATAGGAGVSVWRTQQLLSCLFHEIGQTEEAQRLLLGTVNAQLNSGLDTFSEFPGYDSDKLCPVDFVSYAVLAVHFSDCNDLLKSRKALRLAVRSYTESGSDGESPPKSVRTGVVRRTYVLVLAKAVMYFAAHGFSRLSCEALKMMLACDAAVDTVARSRGAATATDPALRALMKRAQVEVALIATLLPSADSAVAAPALGRDSILLSDDSEDIVRGHLSLAVAAFCLGDSQTASEALCNAVSTASDAGLQGIVPLERYLQSSKLLLSAGRVDAALSIALTGQRVHTSASLALVAAICYLRLDLPEQSEIALREANMLDNRNAEVWAYQALMCLAVGYQRLTEAEAALAQALRLGLAAAPVLRELGTAFIAVDKLQTAEDLIRRALAAEGGKGSPYTRKLLGDVLAGQQQAVQAVNEYQALVSDGMLSGDNVDPVVQLQAAEQCVALLKTLGRNEELATLGQIIEKLRAQL